MITLYQFPRAKNFPNLSPFCCKLETFLRASKIDYKTESTRNFKRNPKGSIPYLGYKNEIIGDSTLAVNQLNKDFSNPLDGHLSAEQKAQGVAIQTMMEDHLAQCLSYFRWVDAEVWPNFRNIIFKGLPAPVMAIVPGMLHRRAAKRLKIRGMGMHTRQEILDFAAKDIEAVSVLLGSKKFLFGDRVSSFDCVVFGVIGNILKEPMASPLTELARKYPNLQAHTQLMLSTYYPELNQ